MQPAAENWCKNLDFYDNLHETPLAIKRWHDKLACHCPSYTSKEILLSNSPLAKKIHLPCLKHHSGNRHSAEYRAEKSCRLNAQFVQSQGRVWHHSGQSLSFKYPCPHLSEDYTGPGLCVSLPATYFRAATWIPISWGSDNTHAHTHTNFNQSRNNHCRKDLACF